MKTKFKNGYTLVELMIVISITTILASILMPKFDIITQRAFQSKARGNLGLVRSGINLYYADHDGTWPLTDYPEGDVHYTSFGLSLTSILVPNYMTQIPVPKLVDRRGEYNELAVTFDDSANSFMKQNPPMDVFILWGPADYTPLLNSPYVFDNKTGLLYYPNGNYDASGMYFYNW